MLIRRFINYYFENSCWSITFISFLLNHIKIHEYNLFYVDMNLTVNVYKVHHILSEIFNLFEAEN
jgi:hypothetical protein